MGLTLAEKLIQSHLIDGQMIKGEEIGIKIDQTLTQDSTGTMAYLQFEALDLDRVKTEKSVAYIDHNMLQTGFENADDHKYIQTVASKYGILFSKPGNGVCHQVHIERFGIPGKTLLGSDSHTPTCGGLGMLAIGAGGLDVAVAMGGGAYYLPMPKIFEVHLTGKLQPFVTAKDIILEVLKHLTVKGGVGYIMEYTGDGVANLSVPERATITNMGAELGATTSIFPSDEVTRIFMKKQQREDDFTFLAADDDAIYDNRIEIDLSTLEPQVACPFSPDNVKLASELEKEHIKVDQVHIGSCTNSSLVDMQKVAQILKGKSIPAHVSLVIAPGSKQVLNMLAKDGSLSDMIMAGARLLESGCGPCIGMGQSPCSNGISLRTINRNFFGRSGTKSASVYLCSPEVAVVSALKGYLVDPRHTNIKPPIVSEVDEFLVSDNLVILPEGDHNSVEIVRGPNIKPFPKNVALTNELEGECLIKVEDNITTDHIMPSDSKLLPYRSNVPHLANYCLTPCDESFPQRAKEKGGGIIVGGENYGQGSSREHAALAPLQLGIRAVLAKSFARIHEANLVNNGILPLVFKNKTDYDKIDIGDHLIIEHCKDQLKKYDEKHPIIILNETKKEMYQMDTNLSNRQMEMIEFGGLLNVTKAKSNDKK